MHLQGARERSLALARWSNHGRADTLAHSGHLSSRFVQIRFLSQAGVLSYVMKTLSDLRAAVQVGI